jgi:hypothetical protein
MIWSVDPAVQCTANIWQHHLLFSIISSRMMTLWVQQVALFGGGGGAFTAGSIGRCDEAAILPALVSHTGTHHTCLAALLYLMSWRALHPLKAP